MLVYFFSISYGIYLATIFEFFKYTNVMYLSLKKYGEFDFYIGRQPGYIFDIKVYYKHQLRINRGYGLLDF